MRLQNFAHTPYPDMHATAVISLVHGCFCDQWGLYVADVGVAIIKV
jgi:hypothetical protein